MMSLSFYSKETHDESTRCSISWPMQEPRFHHAPSPLGGQRRLCRSRCLNEVRVPLRLMAKAAPGEDDEQQGTEAEGDDIDSLPAPVDNRRSPSTDDQMRGDEQGNQTKT